MNAPYSLALGKLLARVNYNADQGVDPGTDIGSGNDSGDPALVSSTSSWTISGFV